MRISKKIQQRFYKTQIFKGLLTDFSKTNKKRVISTKDLEELTKKVETMPDVIKQEVEKARMLSEKEAVRFRGVGIYNSLTNPDRKPNADIPFSYLRRMASIYPIARACINRRITQITQLGWDITTIDEVKDEKGFESQIKLVKSFFKQPIGHKTRLRELLTILVDDLLTLDAISFEMRRTRGGEFINLVPVDPTTIVLKVTETGATPEPPEYAYVQIIDGQEINSFTTDEMIYDCLHPRSFTPYGFAPLESLIIQVESAIRGALYNLNYFKESNVPEGFVTLPEEVASTKALVEEWQMWFDLMLAGDPRFMHRLKILPGGAEYMAAKKPEDMAFERFEMWLLQQTCMAFDVQPQDIGVTYQVNKATGENQSVIAKEKGLYPVANFIKEIFDDIIQVEFGLENLQWKWTDINPVDRKEEAEIAEKEIKIGVLSGDEYRMQRGLEPIGLKHYVETSQGPIFVEDLVSGKVGPAASAENARTMAENKDQFNPMTGNKDKEDDNKKKGKSPEELEYKELKAWRKCIFADLEKGKALRVKFPSPYISQRTREEIQNGLKGVTSKFQAKLLFDRFLDPEIRASLTLLEHARKMREIENDEFAFA